MTIRWITDSSGDEITLRIPAGLLESLGSLKGTGDRRLVPDTVTQDNVFQLFGLRPKAYLRFARASKFPNNKLGRLRIALYEDVKAFLTCRPDLSGLGEESAANVTTIDHLTTIKRMAQSARRRRR